MTRQIRKRVSAIISAMRKAGIYVDVHFLGKVPKIGVKKITGAKETPDPLASKVPPEVSESDTERVTLELATEETATTEDAKGNGERKDVMEYIGSLSDEERAALAIALTPKRH